MKNYESAKIDFNKAITVDGEKKPRCLYYLAKTTALQNNFEQTKIYLKQAKKAGFFKTFNNRNEFITDTAFDELEKNPEFMKVRNEVLKIK